MPLRRWICSVLFLLISVPGPRAGAATDCGQPVATSAGPVRGVADEDTQTCSWKGIPYAAPPIGPLRWRAPAPPGPWEGVRDAEDWAPRCMQKGSMKFVNGDPSGEQSEDCLALNIWRPLEEGPHPVFVWIHGGGLVGGTANTPMYHGDRLAETGKLVVVSINYRLNIFGFYATEALREEDPNGSAGNYGLLDQIFALKWVRDNIAAFGGDPANVTIAGESAGGWSVCNLLSSPLAEGLYHQAIIESGGCHAVSSMERGYEVAKRAAGELKCMADDLGCLRAIPARKLLRKGVAPEIDGFEWLPRLDNYVLTGVPIDQLEAGKYTHVPLLAGAMRDEAYDAVLIHPRQLFEGARRYPRRLAANYGPEAVDDIIRLYSLDDYRRPKRAYRQILTDVALACPTLSGAIEVSRQEPNTWIYRFDYDEFRFAGALGAFHGMELPFVFGNKDRWPARVFYNKRRARKIQPLTDAVMGYWTNFARVGDPNGPGLPVWPAFAESTSIQILDKEIRTEPLADLTAQRCDLWQAYSETHPWIVETLGFLGHKPGYSRGVVEVTPAPAASPDGGAPEGGTVEGGGASGETPEGGTSDPAPAAQVTGPSSP